MRRPVLLALPVVAGLVAVAVTLGLRGGGEPVDAVDLWYAETAAAVQAQSPAPDPVLTRTWALAWLAADRATEQGPDPAGAMASAVHAVLSELVPARQPQLDAALERSSVSDGAGRRGRAAAARVLAERAGDGLTREQVDRPVALPAPAPGVYRPTPPDLLAPRQAGSGQALPFLLRRPDEVRAAPPSALDGPAYRADAEELQRLGGARSSARSDEQTEVALFWSGSLVPTLTPAVRAAVDGRPPREAAELLSDLHRVLLDVQTACYAEKYVYLFWRPVTALPGFEPLLVTPPSPEHPSGHTCYAAALAEVLDRRVGPVRFSLTVDGTTRSYDAWSTVVQENVDARVWGGVHFRTADRAGAELGRTVADLGLTRLAE